MRLEAIEQNLSNRLEMAFPKPVAVKAYAPKNTSGTKTGPHATRSTSNASLMEAVIGDETTVAHLFPESTRESPAEKRVNHELGTSFGSYGLVINGTPLVPFNRIEDRSYNQPR